MSYIRVIQWLYRWRPTIQPPEGLLVQQLATQGYCLHCFDLTGTKARGGGECGEESKSFDSGGFLWGSYLHKGESNVKRTSKIGWRVD